MPRRRVVVLARSIPLHPSAGGMEQVGWRAAVLLSQTNEVEVVTTPVPGWPHSFLVDGIPVRTIDGAAPGRYSFRWWIRTARDPGAVAADVVLSISASATAMVWRPRSRPRFIFQVHGTALANALSVIREPGVWKFAKFARSLWWVFADALTYRRVEAVVAVGPRVSALLTRWPYAFIWSATNDGVTSRSYRDGPPSRAGSRGPGEPLKASAGPRVRQRVRPRLIPIPNGINAELFAPSKDSRLSIRKSLSIDPETRVGISVSRLDRHKGVDRAIEAMARPATAQTRLIVVGDGPEADALRAQATSVGVTDRVHFVGRIGQAEAAKYLSAADFFLFPVRDPSREGLPLSLLEALASGLQVLVPESGHFGEDLDSLFLHVDMGDANLLATTISQLPAPPPNRRSRLPHRYDEAVLAVQYRNLVQ